MEKAEKKSGTGKILVMDDEDFIKDILTEMLNILGYDSISASNGEEALEILRNAEKTGVNISACILDLTVHGGRGGSEIINEIKQINPEASLIASSGQTDANIMSDPETYGFSGSLYKPFKINDLAELMKK